MASRSFISPIQFDYTQLLIKSTTTYSKRLSTPYSMASSHRQGFNTDIDSQSLRPIYVGKSHDPHFPDTVSVNFNLLRTILLNLHQFLTDFPTTIGLLFAIIFYCSSLPSAFVIHFITTTESPRTIALATTKPYRLPPSLHSSYYNITRFDRPLRELLHLPWRV
ncbi:hypothetical protein BDN72DRAFT_843858 [Pluteus cervinus]|uniref:Uncharacterized protein n=1 Tax=Pluteus cervinus TaxID=181527 RepID=A0ACD3AMF4_9AGAR|nr:hypothetical protein BDN72DRAFT_843858 [Pluteus cervinus]